MVVRVQSTRVLYVWCCYELNFNDQKELYRMQYATISLNSDVVDLQYISNCEFCVYVIYLLVSTIPRKRKEELSLYVNKGKKKV